MGGPKTPALLNVSQVIDGQRLLIGAFHAVSSAMTVAFGRLDVRVALCVIAVLAGHAGTAAAQVSVPGNYSTIQAAINAVVSGSLPDGTTIDVHPGTYFENLSVANTSRSVTVRGVGGAAATIVDAGGRNTPVLHVLRATGQVVFRGLTFRNGASSAEGGGFLIRESSPSLVDSIFTSNSAFNGGGGALFTSNATFTRCIIRSNSASHFGGGVYIIQGSRPIFTNTDILSNVSGAGGAGVGNNGAGGGIFSHDSSPTFRGARINGNSSKFAGGGLFHQGMFNSPYGRSLLVVDDSELADNVSSQFPGEPNPAEGGGMHVEDNATATLTRVRVLRNRAGTGGGLNAYRGRYDVVDSIVDANQSTSGFGGGIAATSNFATPQEPPSIVNLTKTLVRNNTAPLGGGIVTVGDNFSSLKASLALTSSVVSGNQSQTQGGGILASRSNLSTADSLIINNSVAGGANPYGGGLLITTTSAATINSTTISHNIAGQHGGGIFVNDNSTINMSGSRVYDNTAGTRGGGLFVGGGQSGTIQTSIIADNTGSQLNAQINEDSCSSVTYPNNLITATAFSGCSTLASRAPGTDSTSKPRFAVFLAVPTAGTTTTLAWSVARATSVTIAGAGTWNSPNNSPTGTVDVTPGSSVTYSLTAAASSVNGGNYGAVTAGFVVVLPPSLVTGCVDSDFDGDRKADIAVFRPSNGAWYARMSSSGLGAAYNWGSSGDIPVSKDYDGDGRVDVAVFRQGVWYILRSGTLTATTAFWGGASDIPVPADYDGDGKADVAVFRPSTGSWYIVYSGTQTAYVRIWGGGDDIPVPADYDGDGKDDVAVFRPSTGTWYIVHSGTQAGIARVWGGSGDTPVPGDYDGDGKADVAVYRSSTGTWYMVHSGTQAGITRVWGSSSDTPVPGDYDGDGKIDVAVFRPSIGAWYILQSGGLVGAVYTWGGGGDIPLLKP